MFLLDTVEQFVQIDQCRIGLQLRFLLEVSEQRMVEDEVGVVDDDLWKLQRSELREELPERYRAESIPAGEIERFVVEQIKCIGRDPELVAEPVIREREEELKE